MKKNIYLLLAVFVVVNILAAVFVFSQYRNLKYVQQEELIEEQPGEQAEEHGISPPQKQLIEEQTEEHEVSLPQEKNKGRIAIVIDDLGYNRLHLEQIFQTDAALTLSILPHQPFSAMFSEQAREHGYECILHMPMEPLSDKVRLEPKTILTSMTDNEIFNCIDEALESVPNAVGISNHMGSRATADERVMRVVLDKVKLKGLYFMDSLTTAGSVCSRLCAPMGVSCIQRDIFLDGKADADYIRLQFEQLKNLAFKKGQAVGIMHDRDLSIEVMNQIIPEIQRSGIKFVFLSELVK